MLKLFGCGSILGILQICALAPLNVTALLEGAVAGMMILVVCAGARDANDLVEWARA